MSHPTLSGRALYLWAADSNGKSACSGECAKAWQPVITKASPDAVRSDGKPLFDYWIDVEGVNNLT